MQTVLNTIIDRARQSQQRGAPKFNPYATGTLRHLAYELGFAEDGCVAVATRSDGQIYGVMEVEDGQFQSIVPRDLAESGEGYVHTTLEDAANYLCELALTHGLQAEPIAA